MGKLIDINALNKNNDYINNNINARLIDNASKNLLPFPETKTVRGITFSATTDGGIHAEGVKDIEDDWINYTSYATFPLKAGKYIVTRDSYSKACYLSLYNVDKNVSIVDTYNLMEEVFTLTEDTNEIAATLTVANNVSSPVNFTSYIMLRRAEISDNTFEPYYRTQKQLDSDLLSTNTLLVDNACKNIAPPFDEVVDGVVSLATSQKIYVTNKIITISLDIARIDGVSISNTSLWAIHKISQYDINNNFISNIILSETDGIIILSSGQTRFSKTIEVNTNTEYIIIYFSNFNDDTNFNTRKYNLQVEYGKVATPYKPYYKSVKQLDSDLTDISNYTGYTDNDIYGLEVDYENNKFTRLAGAIGKTGGTDFDTVNAYGGRKRCNLTDNGVLIAYYGDAAYTETGALTQAVTVNGTEYPVRTSVQVMVEQPKFYYKVVPLKLDPYTTQNGDIGYHIRKARYYISDTPKNGFKLHPAFIRNGAEKERIYLSAYEGCLYDVSESSYISNDSQVADFNTDKMSSIANVKPISGLTQNLTRPNARKLAQNRGIGWEQMYIHTASATQLLFIIEYGTLNSQNAIGNGVVSKASGTGNESENTGGTSALGNASGSVLNNEVSYRGEENFWGNIWAYEDGINIQNPSPFNNGEYGNAYISDNNFSDDTNSLPYEDTNIYPCKINGDYISAFGYNEIYDWLFIPTEVMGNDNSPVGDMFWNPNASWRVAALTGHWTHAFRSGAFALACDIASSNRGRDVGGRLVYIPHANESNRSLKQIDEDLTGINTLLIDNAPKNLFDYDKWVGTTVRNGTAIYENYGVTLTANGYDCYTTDTAGYTLHIPVQANKNYILSWNCISENSDLTEDRVFVFFNGVQNNNIKAYAINKQLQFTVPNNIDFITIRFGVQNNGDTVSYSNIMLRHAEVTDNTFEPYYRTQKQLDKDLSSMIYRDENGSTVLTSYTIDNNDDAYIIIKPESNNANLSIIDGDEFAIQHWNNVDFDDINYINIRSDEISITSESSFELNIGSEGGRISIDSSIQLLDYGGNALKLISRDANESQIYIKCIDNNSGNEHIQSAITLNKKDIHIIANKDTASSNTYGDIYIQTNNMQSEVTLKQYIQGVMNGTY